MGGHRTRGLQETMNIGRIIYDIPQRMNPIFIESLLSCQKYLIIFYDTCLCNQTNRTEQIMCKYDIFFYKIYVYGYPLWYKWCMWCHLKASMTYEVGVAPVLRLGFQDRDTEVRLTSVTSGLEGALGMRFGSVGLPGWTGAPNSKRHTSV